VQLTAGSALGPYVIVERIGAGGVGLVQPKIVFT